MTLPSVRGLQCAFFYEPNVFCRWCWLGPYLPCYICTDQSQVNMYHRWLDTRERDLFLPTCGRSKFSYSNIMGLSLYVTIFKIIIVIIYIYIYIIPLSVKWVKSCYSHETFIFRLCFSYSLSSCLYKYFFVKFNIDLFMKVLKFHNLGT